MTQCLLQDLRVLQLHVLLQSLALNLLCSVVHASRLKLMSLALLGSLLVVFLILAVRGVHLEDDPVSILENYKVVLLMSQVVDSPKQKDSSIIREQRMSVSTFRGILLLHRTPLSTHQVKCPEVPELLVDVRPAEHEQRVLDYCRSRVTPRTGKSLLMVFRERVKHALPSFRLKVKSKNRA